MAKTVGISEEAVAVATAAMEVEVEATAAMAEAVATERTLSDRRLSSSRVVLS